MNYFNRFTDLPPSSTSAIADINDGQKSSIKYEK